jgi:GTP pyrophosphokinase
LNYLRETSGDVIARITEALQAKLVGEGLKAEVYGRQKHPYSIWRKMQNKEVSFENLSDMFGFRVVVQSIEDCYRALGVIHSAWPIVPGRFKDYISVPKPNGYRSLHTSVIGPERRRIEIQIRTQAMHDTAERGVAAHWRYKEGFNGHSYDVEMDEYRWLQDLVAMLEQGGPADEFLEHTKLQLFQDQVFCFTPKGDLIVLPKGATPIDFAYAVHTDVGDTCVGARINGRQVPLHTTLTNGDSIEIIRSNAQTPSPTWENIAVTGRAKTAIRRFVRQRARGEYVRLGREVLEREFTRARRAFSDKAIQEALRRLKQDTDEDVFADVGQGIMSASDVLEAAFPGTVKKPFNLQLKKKAPPKLKSGAPIPIKGLTPGLAVHMADCCHPLPGDRIVGIMTEGRGIDVHTIDCAQLENFYEEPDRWKDISWESEAEEKMTPIARIKVVIVNERGALGMLTNTISDQGGNITNLQITERSSDFWELNVDIEVLDAKHLTQVQAALRASPLISSVRRIRG